MSSSNLVSLIVQAQDRFDSGCVKQQLVLNKLECTGLNHEIASILIGDILCLMKSEEAVKLFNDSTTVCT